MKHNCLTAFIFARGGSKGVKNKNIRLVNNIPLLGHAIKCALDSKYINNIIVSTDDKKIANVAEKYGASFIQRPKELAADEVSEVHAWRHAINECSELLGEQNELFISLPSTSPFRTPDDIDDGIQRYMENDCDLVMGISASKISPHLTMVEIGDDGFIKLVLNDSTPTRRQDVPLLYNITSCVYITNVNYIMNCERLIDGRVSYVIIPEERSLDIDTEFELYLADIMSKNPFKAWKK